MFLQQFHQIGHCLASNIPKKPRCKIFHKYPKVRKRTKICKKANNRKKRANNKHKLINTLNINTNATNTNKLLPYQRHKRKLKFLTGHALLEKQGGKTKQFPILIDTGADTSAMNYEFAKKHFSQFIRTDAEASNINGIGGVSVDKYIHLYLTDPDNSHMILSEEIFWLIPNLHFTCIGSGGLCLDLGAQITPQTMRRKDRFVHTPEPDENFGTCNNWDDDTIIAHYNYNATLNDNILF